MDYEHVALGSPEAIALDVKIQTASASVELSTQAKIGQVDSNTSDIDSAVSISNISSTQSLRSSLFESIEENGRTYHKYKQGQYYLPNDETEQSRLDIQHQLFLLTLDGKLSLAPISDPRMVLDIGTGTGNWAKGFGVMMEFATQNPSARVIGTELSAIQPDYVPTNCSFLIDDAEDEWSYSHEFDYIHGRALMSCFQQPATVFKKAYDALAPGGYFEMQDVFFKPHSIDGTVDGTALQNWNDKLIDGAKLIGRDWHCTPKYAQYFKDVGFQDVVEKKFYWPGNTWPKGKKQKLMGMCMLANGLEGLPAVSLGIFTRVFKMPTEEVETLMEQVRKDMKDKSIHVYYPIYIVYGRKPL